MRLHTEQLPIRTRRLRTHAERHTYFLASEVQASHLDGNCTFLYGLGQVEKICLRVNLWYLEVFGAIWEGGWEKYLR